MADSDNFDIVSMLQMLSAQMRDAAEGTNKYSRAVAEQIAVSEEQRRTEEEAHAEDEERRKTRERQAKEMADAEKEYKAAIKETKAAFKKLGSELLNIGDAGIKFASTLGTTATRGVQIEIQNRLAVAKQLFNFNTDLAVTVDQLKGAQQSFTDVFTGAAAGMQISAEGSRQFAENLKKGFGSEFQATPEAMRAMIEMGISSSEQMRDFRQATGRAGLSANQLTNLYNKNRLSFLLYGNSFAKTAVQAEKLGINLSSLQNAQKGLVTNLDGTIDTVAQLNQLGAQVDFGNLVRIAETEGPQALMEYARATIPANLLQSTSTRALFEQLGVSAEDFLKSGGKQKSAAQNFEDQLTETAKDTDKFGASLIAAGSRIKQLLTGSFANVGVAAFFAAKALYGLGWSGIKTAITNTTTALTGLLGPLALFAVAAAGIAAIFYGRKMVKEGNVGKGLAVSALGGAATGAVIGGKLGGGYGALGGAIIGAGVGLVAAGTATPTNDMYSPGSSITKNVVPANDMYSPGTSITRNVIPTNDMYSPGLPITGNVVRANDIHSPGYGNRVLVTPNAAFALNNADDIVAGTELLPEGSLRFGNEDKQPQQNNSDLLKKIDSLISTIENATTTINVGGSVQTVPRLQMVGVYSRNEVR